MMGGSRTADVPWVLIGGGGHARSVYDVLQRKGDRLLALYADNPRPHWLPDYCDLLPLDQLGPCNEPVRTLVAIGDPSVRERFTARLRADKMVLGTLVAKSATIADDAQVGSGAMVMEHAHVGPGAVVGTSVIINTGAIVEHDCRVGDFAHIAPGAVLLGGAAVGERVLVGASAVILTKMRAARDSTIGAQAVVTREVEPTTTVRGVPAREVNMTQDW